MKKSNNPEMYKKKEKRYPLIKLSGWKNVFLYPLRYCPRGSVNLTDKRRIKRKKCIIPILFIIIL